MLVSDRGVALLTALALLFLFSMLGVAYVTWMTTELTKTGFELRSVQARNIARGGIQAAISEVQAALAAKRAVPATMDPVFSVLKLREGAPAGVGPDDNLKGAAHVTIHEEGVPPANNPAAPRSFSITSQGVVTPAANKSEIRCFVKAVVVFGPGAPETVYWTETS